MISREDLIEYIRKHDSEYSDNDLASYSLTALVLIKVRVELELHSQAMQE